MLPARLATWRSSLWTYRACIVLALIVLCTLPPAWAAAFAMLIGGCTLYELLAMTRWSSSRIAGIALVSCGIVYFLDAATAFALLVLINMAAGNERLRHVSDNHLERALASELAISLLSVLIAFSLCRALPALLLDSTQRAACLLLLCAAFLQDFLASAIGQRFSIGRLAPALSQRKTVSGALGGFLICSLLASTILRPTPVHVCILFLALACLSDLLFSWVKRILQVKDYSQIFGAKGGLLDRIDSLALPLIYLFLATAVRSPPFATHVASG